MEIVLLSLQQLTNIPAFYTPYAPEMPGSSFPGG